MPDDPKPEAPPDPFAAGHANYVAVVENFTAYRRAGAGWLTAVGCQAAVFVAAHIVASGGNGEQQ